MRARLQALLDRSREDWRPAAGAITVLVVLVAAIGVLAGGGDAGDHGSADPVPSALPPVDTGVRLPEAGAGAGEEPDEGPAQGQGAGPVELTVDDLPKGWPDDFPLPDDGIVDLGSSTTVDGVRVVGATVLLEDGDPAEVVAGYLDALDGDGYAVLRDDVDGVGADAVGTVTFETDEYVGDVLATVAADSAVTLTLTATFPG